MSDQRPRRGWRLILFARCDDAVRAASDALDGPVEADRRLAGHLHALGCPGCRRERRWLRWLGRWMARREQPAHEVPVEPTLAADAADRIRAALDTARADDP